MQVSTYAVHNPALNQSKAIPITYHNSNGIGKACAQCGTTTSPQWRKGPLETTLCNLHGIVISKLRKENSQVAAYLNEVEMNPSSHTPQEIFKKVEKFRQSAPKKKRSGAIRAVSPNPLATKITKFQATIFIKIIPVHFHLPVAPQAQARPFSTNGKIPIENLLN